MSASGTSEDCKKCRTKRSLPIPSFDMEEQRSSKRLKDVPANETAVVNTDSTVSIICIDKVDKPTPIIALPNKENLNPAETINPAKTEVAVTQETKKLINPTENKIVEIIEVDDDDVIGSVCSEESDLSENLTLAQVASKSQYDQEENERISTDEVTVITNDAGSNLHNNFDSHELTRHEAEQHGEVVTCQSPSDLASASTCFICGCSFDRVSTGFKGRLNHIKRCSKKHGVTGHEMKVNDDDEDFQTSPSRRVMNPDNPYTRINDSWHADAEQDLKLAGNKQTTMTSFFEAPVKSLNNVLMAGAKRIAKTGDLLLAAAQKKQQQKGTGKTGWGSSRNYSNSPCPFYKKIPGTDFVCDGFMYAKSALTKNYFLTHFHSDHYGGINKSWNAGIIYCSLPTANLVSQQLGVDKKYLHPLGMNTPVVIESQGKPVTVTLLDANHCPGAVMFLFNVGRRHILHVGDFRWNRDRMYPDLKDFITLKYRLDDLFLDTTYCNEKYRLPTQEEAIRAAVEKAEEEINMCRKTGKRLLMLFGAYTIGKERIYLTVAEKLGMKVYVDKRRYRILSALNWPPERINLLTTDKDMSCLWVVPLSHINFKKLPSYADNGSTKVFSKQTYDKIVGFRPTGWSLTGCTNDSLLNTRTSGIFTVHGVPYSEHSSFPELVDCLDCLKPRRIIPTVSVSKSDEQVALLLKELKNKTNGI